MTNTFGPICHADGVRGFGNINSPVMLITDKPTQNELLEGRTFTGEAGRLLDALLAATGWSRSNAYCTTIHCIDTDTRHPYYTQVKDYQELPTLTSGCFEVLRGDIERQKPQLIIPLGKEAAETFFPQHTIGQVQGCVLWQEHVLGTSHACYVMPTYNPRAVLWGSSRTVQTIYRDFDKIKHVVEWQPYAPQAKVDYVVADSEDDVFNWFADYEPNTILAVDIESAQGKDETGLLDVFNDRLLCVAFSDGTRTIVIPEQYAHVLEQHHYNDLHALWTFHNGNFDVQGINRFLGIKLPIIHDTMLMAYNLDEREARIHGLKFLAREYLSAGFYEVEAHEQARAFTKTGKAAEYRFDTVDKDVLYQYNAHDAAYTARLVPILMQMMVDDNVTKPYNELIIPSANTFADIQYRGINVDMNRLNELCLKWYPLWLQAKADLQAHGQQLGAAYPFNVNSNPQLKHLIFDILGIKVQAPKLSKKTGTQSLDKEVLEELRGEHSIIDEILDFRQLDKIVGYTLTVRDHIKLDGLLHATTKQETVTGRTAYVDPPLQTIPNPAYERNQKYKEFREIIIPHNSETHIIAEADLSRAEMWAAVTYSHDAVMLTDLQSGDPHTQTAIAALGKTREQVTKQDRTEMKHVTFGKMYGRKERALWKAELKRWTFAQVVAFSKRWDERYAEYIAWNNAQRKLVQAQGELVSLTGRKRRFRLILPDDYMLLNEAVNFPIQNLANDTVLKAMIILHETLALYDSYILIMIHDSITFELSKKWLHITIPLIRTVMEQVMFDGAYPIPIEMSLGSNWGNTEKIDLENPDAYLRYSA